MRAEYQRCAKDSTASMTARIAITTAIQMTVRAAECAVMWLTTRPARTGVMTAISASAMIIAKKISSATRYGRANRRIRRQVPLGTLRADLSPRGIDRHAYECIVMDDIVNQTSDGRTPKPP